MSLSYADDMVDPIANRASASTAFDSVMILIGIILFVIICGLFHRSLRRILTELFAPARDQLDAMSTWTQARITGVRNWINTYFQGEETDKPNLRVSYLIGAVVFTVLMVVFILADFFVTLLTVQGLMGNSKEMHLPVSLDFMVGASLICSAIFWGLVLFDLVKTTRIAPWERMSKITRHIYLVASILFLFLAASLASLLGVYRGLVFAESPTIEEFGDSELNGSISSYMPGEETLIVSKAIEDAKAPDLSVPNWQRNIAVFTLAGIPLLTTFSAAGAGVGPVILMQYMAVGFAFLLLAFLAISLSVFRAVRFVWMMIWGFLDSILGFFIAIAQVVATPISKFLDNAGIYNEISSNQPFLLADQAEHVAPVEPAQGLNETRGIENSTTNFQTNETDNSSFNNRNDGATEDAHEKYAAEIPDENGEDGSSFFENDDFSISNGWNPYGPSNGTGEGA